MESEGHKVIPFSVNYPQNRSTPYAKYFVAPPSQDISGYLFKDLDFSFLAKLKFAKNSIYHSEAKRKLDGLIKDEKPDVLNILELHNVISPSIIDAAHKLSVPIVMRLSEYHLMCPAYHFFRDNQICEECKNGWYHALRHSCLKKSFAVTSVKVFSSYFHHWRKTYDKVNAFITPSKFMRKKLIEFGFDGGRIHYVPSFVNTDEYIPSYSSDNYVVYFGRIAKEKGLIYLIQAFEGVNIRLVIVGESTDGEDILLKKYVQEHNMTNVQFVGFKSGDELHNIIRNSMFTICPSIWYENTPMSIYESFALGKPVLGTNIGSIAEQIDSEVDGLLFNIKDVEDLRNKVNYLIDNRHLLSEMGRQARKKIEEKYNPGVHYQNLMNIYQKIN